MINPLFRSSDVFFLPPPKKFNLTLKKKKHHHANFFIMSMINETNSISSNNFLRDCIDLAIDGFLFRGITPSDHYYRFSQSFPKAFTLLSSYSNGNNSSMINTPKQSHHHSSKHQRSTNVPPLDLSSLNANILLEQQPVSTILSTTNTGITIKTKKPVYSPKDVKFFHRISFKETISFSFSRYRHHQPLIVELVVVVDLVHHRQKLPLLHPILPTLLSQQVNNLQQLNERSVEQVHQQIFGILLNNN